MMAEKTSVTLLLLLTTYYLLLTPYSLLLTTHYLLLTTYYLLLTTYVCLTHSHDQRILSCLNPTRTSLAMRLAM